MAFNGKVKGLDWRDGHGGEQEREGKLFWGALALDPKVKLRWGMEFGIGSMEHGGTLGMERGCGTWNRHEKGERKGMAHALELESQVLFDSQTTCPPAGAPRLRVSTWDCTSGTAMRHSEELSLSR